MTQTHEDIIKDTASEILAHAGFPDAQIAVYSAQEEERPFFVCDLRMEADSQFLIGQHGVNLRAFQHLLRIIVRKKIGGDVGLTVDINGYQKERHESLIQQAQEAATQAVRECAPVTLSSLSAYERRVIHMALAQREDVCTESIGTGEGRRVIVRPRTVGE
ncbi:MAG TPA: R3H domain-containing nucleic acid-binding protein [Patescibacteria group bacterium]|nr:R3H domain-containing nucleic acid-binding protein [Patescibacteria group bacterium]